MEKVGRNDQCPCGSGKKYKKCCLGKDENRLVISDPFEELDVDKMLSDYAEMEVQNELVPNSEIARFNVDLEADSNYLPCEDFDGLTPAQMLTLINHPFASPKIVEFPKVMSEWPETPAMWLLATLIQEIGPTGLKLEKDGYLPDKVAHKLAQVYFQEEAIPELMQDGTIQANYMFDAIDQVLELAATVDIVERNDNMLSLGPECIRLFAEVGFRAFYPMILRAASEDVSWGRGDDEIPEMFEFQDTFAYTLYLLHKYGDEFRKNTFYEDAILRAFPTLLQDEDGNPMIEGYESRVRFCYTSRALVDYAGLLGLVEIDECPDDDPVNMIVKKTPLLDDAVRFKI